MSRKLEDFFKTKRHNSLSNRRFMTAMDGKVFELLEGYDRDWYKRVVAIDPGLASFSVVGLIVGGDGKVVSVSKPWPEDENFEVDWTVFGDKPDPLAPKVPRLLGQYHPRGLEVDWDKVLGRMPEPEDGRPFNLEETRDANGELISTSFQTRENGLTVFHHVGEDQFSRRMRERTRGELPKALTDGLKEHLGVSEIIETTAVKGYYDDLHKLDMEADNFIQVHVAKEPVESMTITRGKERDPADSPLKMLYDHTIAAADRHVDELELLYPTQVKVVEVPEHMRAMGIEGISRIGDGVVLHQKEFDEHIFPTITVSPSDDDQYLTMKPVGPDGEPLVGEPYDPKRINMLHMEKDTLCIEQYRCIAERLAIHQAVRNKVRYLRYFENAQWATYDIAFTQLSLGNVEPDHEDGFFEAIDHGLIGKFLYL